VWRELRDASADVDLAVPHAGETGPNEGRKVAGLAQGAIASCGGGESEQVSDRPRADGGGPVAADVGVISRESMGIGVPDPRVDEGTRDGGGTDTIERGDGAREWRGIPDGRTNIKEAPGRRRRL